jgi:broad specificity phosphatase PhoE
LNHILFVRHGETDYNLQRRWQGHLDTPLNARGLEQAHSVALRLAHLPIRRIVSSDLQRALVTAHAIADAGPHPRPVPDRDLREFDTGAWTGLTHQEVLDCCGQVFERWNEGDLHVRIPAGECRADLIVRGTRAQERHFNDVGSDGMGLIVSHGGFIRTYLRHLVNEPSAIPESIGNTAVLAAVREGATWRMTAVAGPLPTVIVGM